MASITSGNVDRISPLPDDIIVHILSFLPTKYSVATRILSSRWKLLFASVPVLDFDCSYTSVDPCFNTTIRFLNFVDWAFESLNSLCITKFRFNYCGNYFPKTLLETRLETWISQVVCHNVVREIDISVEFLNEESLYLYDGVLLSLFSCETLEILKLGGNFVLSNYNPLSFPCLKTLEVRLKYFTKSTQKLFSTSCVLEDLLVSNGRLTEILDISVPTLKRLIIDHFYCYTIVLNVPLLERFDFINFYVPEIRGESLKSLCGAIISPSHLTSCITNLLKKVSNARYLFFSSSVVEHLFDLVYRGQCVPLSIEYLPTFQSLIRLELGRVPGEDLVFLVTVLEVAANLQVLVFSEGFIECKHLENHQIPGVAPACVSLHLNNIEFRQFSMLDIECELVKYFLDNAKVLEKMVIKPSLSLGMQEETRNNLQSFSSYSTTCQIVIQ